MHVKIMWHWKSTLRHEALALFHDSHAPDLLFSVRLRVLDLRKKYGLFCNLANQSTV